MGKLPSWMRIEAYERGETVNQAVVVITIRRWHPSWWLFYWSNAMKSAKEIKSPFYVWFPVALHRFLFFGREYAGDVEIHHE